MLTSGTPWVYVESVPTTHAPAAKTPTVRIQTTFHVCSICGAGRRAVETMELHFDSQHEDVEPTFTTKTSEYGQPASFPVPFGDVVVSA